MKYKLAVFFIAILLGTAQFVNAQNNVIVNPGDAGSLSQSTGLSPAEAQNIIDQATGSQVKPEINIPANGASIAGVGVVIKGVATPGASIDILIQPSSGGGGPILGKAVSDRYGVWSYTLAPSLSDGPYTVQVTAQVGNFTPLKSDSVSFAVSGGGGGLGIGNLFSTSGSSSLIIILAIIISVTFIIVVIVLVMAPYSREKRSTYLDKMKSWETPELLSLDDTQWNDFVNKMEGMRQYFAAKEKNATPGPILNLAVKN